MIKSLLDDEEKQPLTPKSEVEDKIESEKFLEISTETDAVQKSANAFDTNNSADVFNLNLKGITTASNDKPMFQIDSKPESLAATARKSGLAYAAAITLFAAIAFLLGIGWIVDLFLGISPWGKVGGIVLGSIIGFYQFFKLTSQILKDKD